LSWLVHWLVYCGAYVWIGDWSDLGLSRSDWYTAPTYERYANSRRPGIGIESVRLIPLPSGLMIFNVRRRTEFNGLDVIHIQYISRLQPCM
jgi:hypothetical protein